MTEQALDGSGGGAVTRVLEVATGSGYQAAVLADAGCEVWTIEALPELAAEAAARPEALGYDKVHCRQGDGAARWSQPAPFDALLVTAAATALPPPLLDQFKPGGPRHTSGGPGR